MKTFFGLLMCAALALFQAPVQAQSRTYSQAELDALLAPVALYPDPLLSQVLMAATYPADVGEAAAWSRANPHLTGEDAVRAAQDQPWDPSVKSLLAFPDVLARMDESPQWLMDLGQAFLAQEPQVMDTVQGLRRRAQASGHLRSNEHYSVQQQGPLIVVQPVQPQVVYVPYYSPYVVYGPWWWPAYRPVYWRPWRPAPVFVSATFFFGAVDWHHRHVRVVHRPTYVHVTQTHVVPGRWQHNPRRAAPAASTYVKVPEARRQPIVQGAQVQASPRQAAPSRLQAEERRDNRRQPRGDQRRDQRSERQESKPIAQSLPPAKRVESPRREIKREPQVQPRVERQREQPRAASPVVQSPPRAEQRRERQALNAPNHVRQEQAAKPAVQRGRIQQQVEERREQRAEKPRQQDKRRDSERQAQHPRERRG